MPDPDFTCGGCSHLDPHPMNKFTDYEVRYCNARLTWERSNTVRGGPDAGEYACPHFTPFRRIRRKGRS